MNSKYFYNGKELELFSQAKNWKHYFSGFIIPYLKGNVLEAGPGMGSTTPYLNVSKSITSWLLLEPDGQFCDTLKKAIADKKLPGNCSVQQGDIFSLNKKDFFDAVIYIDVLEHIEEDSTEVNKAIALLKPHGYLIILSPAFQSLYSSFDKAIGHFRRYDKKSLKAVANDQVTTIKTIYLDSCSCLLSWGNKLMMKQSYPTSRQIKIWDKVFVPLSRMTDRLVSYNFGKSILGVWKKNERFS